MKKSKATMSKKFIDFVFLPTYFLIIFLGLIRLGPIFCEIEKFPCLRIEYEFFLIGLLLTIPATTFYTVLAFWATVLGLFNIVLILNKEIAPDFILQAPEGEKINESRKIVEIQVGSFPLTLQAVPFRIINRGNVAILPGEAYYRLHFPKTISISNITSVHKISANDKKVPIHMTSIENQPDVHALNGLIPAKIFPNRSSNIFTVDLTFEKPGRYNVEYYFTTDQGFVPKNIKVNDMNEPNKNLGILVFHLN